MLGEATLAADPIAIDEAETLFGEAARIADQQGAVMLRLRTAVSMARLDLRLDRVTEGARQLETALAAIAEDDDGLDLREARFIAARLHDRQGRSRSGQGMTRNETGLA